MSNAIGRTVSIHSGKSAPLRNRPGRQSGINKGVLTGPVEVTAEGIPGDVQVDLRYHGGPFKAICVYAAEHYAHWAATRQAVMPAGSVGENLHTEGILDGEVCLGDEWIIGTARFQVAGPRGPCGNLAAHWGDKDIHLEFKRQRRSGFYLSVIHTGTIWPGDEVWLDARPAPGWNLDRYWDVLDGGKPTAEELDELLAMRWLDDDWKPQLEKKRKRL